MKTQIGNWIAGAVPNASVRRDMAIFLIAEMFIGLALLALLEMRYSGMLMG